MTQIAAFEVKSRLWSTWRDRKCVLCRLWRSERCHIGPMKISVRGQGGGGKERLAILPRCESAPECGMEMVCRAIQICGIYGWADDTWYVGYGGFVDVECLPIAIYGGAEAAEEHMVERENSNVNQIVKSTCCTKHDI